jgi:predicted Zn-dependent peptidase
LADDIVRRRVVFDKGLALIAVDLLHLIDHVARHAAIDQKLLLALGQLKDLAGGFKAADHLAVGEAGLVHGNDFIQGDEPIVVDIGGHRGAGLRGGGRVVLGLAHGLTGLLLVLFIGVGFFHLRADQVAPAGAEQPADQRAQGPIVAGDDSPGGRTAHAADDRALFFFPAGQIFTPHRGDRAHRQSGGEHAHCHVTLALHHPALPESCGRDGGIGHVGLTPDDGKAKPAAPRLGMTATMPAMPEIHHHQLSNGLHLLAEPVDGAQSLAMSWLLPAGTAYEPTGQQGIANLLAELICRGAGGKDARQHAEALDRLGVRRDTAAQTRHLRLNATMTHDKLSEALPLLTDMVRAPQLSEAAFEPSRMLCLQELAALNDEPQQRVMLALKQQHYPEPLGRSPYGVAEDLQSLNTQQVHQFWAEGFVPGGSILAFAGRFDWDQLVKQVESLLGDWQGQRGDPAVTEAPARGYQHVTAETSQMHIGVGYDALPEGDANSVYQKAATAVLSGGMSGRLFHEIREKRGLCYAVFATYAGQKDRGSVLGYAGTTTPRAQETLDVLIDQLHQLSAGATESEFQRAVVGMKSRVVMQGESTGARAGAIADDLHARGRARTLDEIAGEIDGLTLDRLNKFLADHPPGDVTLVTIGPSALELKHATPASAT